MSKKIATLEYLKLKLDKTLLPSVIIDIILHYTNYFVMVEFEDSKTKFVNPLQFNLLNTKNITKISIYGVLVLMNPKNMFLDSKIQSITGNIVLIGDSTGMFRNAISFTGVDISNWDTSQVTNMYCMFSNSINFNGNIGSWDTSQVTDMTSMFSHAENFNQDIDLWNTGNVTNMNYMFSYSKNFNKYIGSWNTGKVKFMEEMFNNAISFNQEIGNWKVSNVTNTSTMFHRALNFNANISNWDTRNVINISWMFCNAINFDQDISGWNLSKVKYKSLTFHGAKKFKGRIDTKKSFWIFGSYYKIVY
jgi:surface protein